MSNIEPTEEQRAAAASFYYHANALPAAAGVVDWVETGDGSDTIDSDVVAFARLLAEREAKLHREYGAAFSAERNEVDTLRARVAELEDDVEAAKTLMRLAQRHGEAATAHVAELEGIVARCTAQMTGDRQYIKSQDREIMRLEVDSKAAAEREAQHLADIKELMDVLSYVPHDTSANPVLRDEAREVLARLAHYDDAKVAVVTLEVKQATPDMIRAAAATPYLGHDEAKADAPASTEGGEG